MGGLEVAAGLKAGVMAIEVVGLALARAGRLARALLALGMR